RHKRDPEISDRKRNTEIVAATYVRNHKDTETQRKDASTLCFCGFFLCLCVFVVPDICGGNSEMPQIMDSLLQDFFKGGTRALSRIITRVENRSEDSMALLQQLFPHSGKSQVIGVTGSPGSGKSTL